MKTATVKKEVQQPLINMKYGAPELLSFYQKYAFRGLLYSIVIAAFVIGSVFVYSSMNAKGSEDIQTRDLIDIREYIIPENTPPKPIEEVAPIDVPKAEQTVKLKDLEALIPQPVAKQESEALTIKTQNALENVQTEQVGKEGTDDLGQVTSKTDDKINEQIGKEIEKEEPKEPVKQIYNPYEVEKAPVAVNLSSVKNSMRYPDIAKASNVEGTCVARILVGTDGGIIKVASISGPDVFHSEVEDKIMNLQFTPALKGGEPVKCYVNVPFKFNLK